MLDQGLGSDELRVPLTCPDYQNLDRITASGPAVAANPLCRDPNRLVVAAQLGWVVPYPYSLMPKSLATATGVPPQAPHVSRTALVRPSARCLAAFTVRLKCSREVAHCFHLCHASTRVVRIDMQSNVINIVLGMSRKALAQEGFQGVFWRVHDPQQVLGVRVSAGRPPHAP